jgi:hypothetical protein
MSHVKIFSWILIAGLALASAPEVFAHGSHKHGEIDPASLDSLYASYRDIRQALSRDDFAAAQAASRAFLKKPVKMPMDISHSLKAKVLLADFRGMDKAADIDAFRQAFLGFSDHMILILSEVKYAGGDSVVVFRCPMANHNKGGEWVQSSGKTANPYLGGKMPGCGTMQKVLYPSGSETSPSHHDGKEGESHEYHHG